MKLNRNGLIGIAAAAFVATGAGAAFATTSGQAASAPLVKAVTRVLNHPDSGNGGNAWAYDDFNRTLTMDAAAASVCTAAELSNFDASEDTCYTAEVSDSGQFNAVVGSDAPNQAVAGVKILRSAKGTMEGTATYVLYAPAADIPSAGYAEKTQNDNFASPAASADTTTDWFRQAFAASAQASVTGAYTSGGNGWDWTYSTDCETWTDSGTNGDGNLPADGNITGKTCILPHLYDGHVVPGSLLPTRVELGWKDGPGVHYVLTRTFGYGFSPAGSPHLGFTGGTVGFWEGLKPGHTYDIELIPAGANRQPLPHAQTGWINVVTP